MSDERNSRSDASQSDRQAGLVSQMREDSELREFVKRWLTPVGRTDKQQAQSIEKILDIGLPLVGDSSSFEAPPEVPLARIPTSPSVINLPSSDLLDELISKKMRRYQARDDDVDWAYTPPFDEALLPKPEHFIDRQEELDTLVQRLKQGGTTGITALRGMGGIGKSALAAKAAERLHEEDAFPDGIAVALCREVTDPSEALRSVLARFDPNRAVAHFGSLADLSEAARRLLNNKRALVILDNVEPDLDVERVVSPLRAANITILITARQSLSRAVVPAEGNLVVDMLSSDNAVTLLVDAYRIAGGEALSAQQEVAAKAIAEALGRHTLAIAVAGGYAASAGRDLELFARELQDTSAALLLSDGDKPEIIEWLFLQSTDALPPDAQSLFFALPAFGDTEFGRSAVIALAEALQLDQPRKIVDLLVSRSLLSAFVRHDLPSSSDRERLRIHLLLNAFAKSSALSRFGSEADKEQRRLASQAVTDYYVDYLRQAPESALDVDRVNFNSAIVWANKQNEWRRVVDLCMSLVGFWRNRWLTKDSSQYLPMGIDAAEALLKGEQTPEYLRAVATLRLAHAQVLLRIGELNQAETNIKSNLKMWESLRDTEKQAIALHYLGQLARNRSDLSQAVEYFDRSLELRRKVGDHRGEGAVLGYLGRIAQARGQLEHAEEFYHQSLAIAREQGDQRGEGRVLNSLGQVALARGDMELAQSHFNAARVRLHATKDRQGENDVATGFGRIALDRGELDSAESIFITCVEVDDEIMDKQGKGADLSLLAQVALERGDLDKAGQLIGESLTIRQEVQDRRGRGVDLSILGRIALEKGDIGEARRYYEDSLVIAKEVENRRGEGATYHQLGVVALASSDVISAKTYFQQSLDRAEEMQSSPDIARAQLSLGRLAGQYEGESLRGCQLVSDSLQRYEKMQRRPDVLRAQAVSREMGCREM